MLDAFDPVMSGRSLVFDAYYKTPYDEVFVEVTSAMRSPIWIDRLYYLLNKINLYNQAKNRTAYLKVLIFTPPNSDLGRMPDYTKHIEKYFAKAISSGLLKIVKLTEKDIRSL